MDYAREDTGIPVKLTWESFKDEIRPWQDRLRVLRQRLEGLPGFGIVFMVPASGHILALRDAFIIAFFGSIGLWLAPVVSALEMANPMTFTAIFSNLKSATTRGDALILVPSLVGPLYLVVAGLSDNPKRKRHQISLFVFAILIAAGSLVIYVTKIANTIADPQFLIHASTMGFFISFVVLYLYFLTAYIPGDVLPALQNAPKSLTEQVLELRKKDEQ